MYLTCAIVASIMLGGKRFLQIKTSRENRMENKIK